MSTTVIPKLPTITVVSDGIPDDPEIQVARYVERAGLSQITEIRVTLVTPHIGMIDPDSLLGQTAEITIDTPHAADLNDTVAGDAASPMGDAADAGTRKVFGMITAVVDQARPDGQMMSYDLTIRPRVSKLARRSRVKLFADNSVPDIVAAVLGDAGFLANRDFVFRLSGTYPARSFTLQFNESDLDFLTRLTEHWGIGFFFEQGETCEVMVFTDGDQSWKQGRVPVIPFNPTGERLGLLDVSSRRQQIPSRYVLRDYNQETPTVDWSRGANLDGGDGSETIEYAANFETMDECSLLLRARLDWVMAQERVFTGTVAEGVIDVGTLFQIKDHPGFDGLSLALTGTAYDFTGNVFAGDGAQAGFSVTFTATLAGRNVRPERTTPKPKVDGLVAGIIESDTPPPAPPPGTQPGNPPLAGGPGTVSPVGGGTRPALPLANKPVMRTGPTAAGPAFTTGDSPTDQARLQAEQMTGGRGTANPNAGAPAFTTDDSPSDQARLQAMSGGRGTASPNAGAPAFTTGDSPSDQARLQAMSGGRGTANPNAGGPAFTTGDSPSDQARLQAMSGGRGTANPAAGGPAFTTGDSPADQPRLQGGGQIVGGPGTVSPVPGTSPTGGTITGGPGTASPVPANPDPLYAKLDEAGQYRVRLLFETDGAQPFAKVRMAQPHGGQGYGIHFPLRPGTEVVLAFLNGDPDRPVIAGVVPNAQMVSPIDRNNQTNNVIRTGGANQIQFQDEAGQENIQLSSPKANTALHIGTPDYPDTGIVMQTDGSLHAYPSYGMNTVTPFAATTGQYVNSTGARQSIHAGTAPFSSAAMSAGSSDYVTAVNQIQNQVQQGPNNFGQLQDQAQSTYDQQQQDVAKKQADYKARLAQAQQATAARQEVVGEMTPEDRQTLAEEEGSVTYADYDQAQQALAALMTEADGTTGTAVQDAQAAMQAGGPQARTQAQQIIQQQSMALGQMQTQGQAYLQTMGDYWAAKSGNGNLFQEETEAAHAYAKAADALADAINERDAIDTTAARTQHREVLASRRMKSNLPDSSFPADIINAYNSTGDTLMQAAIRLQNTAVEDGLALITAAEGPYQSAAAALVAALPPKLAGRQQSLIAEIDAVQAYVEAKKQWGQACITVNAALTVMQSAERDFETKRSARGGAYTASQLPTTLQQSYGDFVQASDAVLTTADSVDVQASPTLSQALAVMDELAPLFPTGSNDLPGVVLAETGQYATCFSTDMAYDQARLKLQTLDLDRQAMGDALTAMNGFGKDTAGTRDGDRNMMDLLQNAAITMEQANDAARNAAWSQTVGTAASAAGHSQATQASLQSESSGSSFASGWGTRLLHLSSDNALHLQAGDRMLQQASMVTIAAAAGSAAPGTGTSSTGTSTTGMTSTSGASNGTPGDTSAGAANPPIASVGTDVPASQPVGAGGTVLIHGESQIILNAGSMIDGSAETINLGCTQLTASATKQATITCGQASITMMPDQIVFAVGDANIVITADGINFTADSISANANSALNLASGTVTNMTAGADLSMQASAVQVMAAADLTMMAINVNTMGVMVNTMGVMVDSMGVMCSTLAPLVTIN